ncbi:MAG: sel1 repeat family protein [Pseudomonadota bacterium]|nr:sel1 repeat family protein [Pseudomonadota bacterium]
MKKIVICLSLLLAGLAHADELADANALFQKKAYPQALQSYTKLANGGNAEAQFHLGEMYWYGEAGAVDEVKADAWFRKAADKGNKSAAAALEIMKQRTLRRAEIDFWTTKYDGADLKSGKYRCVAPRIPAVSKDNAEIDRVSASVAAWQACYNGFVENLNASTPMTKLIPPDIAKLLNQRESDAAKAHLDDVQQRIAADSSIGAKLELADFAAWRSATETWVTEHNALVKSSTASDRSSELDARKNNYVPQSK